MAVFEHWDDAIHLEPAQVKRRLAGEKLKAKDVVVDRPAQCAEIQGSASVPYHAELSGCTCPDFAVNKKPCKHMYRLALDLGLIEKLPEVSKEAERSYLASAADAWRDAFLAGKISAQTYAKIGEAILKQ